MRRMGAAQVVQPAQGTTKQALTRWHGVPKPVSAARDGWMNSNFGSLGSIDDTLAIFFFLVAPDARREYGNCDGGELLEDSLR